MNRFLSTSSRRFFNYIENSKALPSCGCRAQQLTMRNLTTTGRASGRPQQKIPAPDANIPKKSFGMKMLPVLILPSMFLMYGISEHYFQNRQLHLNEVLRQQMEQECDRKVLESKPILFYCVIRRTRGMTHCLSNIKVGDVVQVLEEGVGPNQDYNLCRFPADKPHAMDTIGWYPIRWLQKLEAYERVIHQQSSSST